jgi:hypothetical protein
VAVQVGKAREVGGIPQWEVLAANRAEWEAGLEKVRANERDGLVEMGVSEQQLVVRLFNGTMSAWERLGSTGCASTGPSARERKGERPDGSPRGPTVRGTHWQQTQVGRAAGGAPTPRRLERRASAVFLVRPGQLKGSPDADADGRVTRMRPAACRRLLPPPLPLAACCSLLGCL